MTPLTVSKYTDNPDGTTTNTLSDGSTDTGSYTKNKDGSLNFHTISSAGLNSPKPFDLTPPKPSTGTDGALGSIAASSDAFTKNLTETAALREKGNSDALNAYVQSILSSEGQTTLTDKAYKQTVDPAEAELKDINQQLLEEQHSLDRRLQAIDKNPQGLFGGALEQEKQTIKDQSLARQADLSIVQLAKQGKYDSAKAIADRAVAAKFEQSKNLTEALKVNYEANKDLFTTAEQRAFETQLKDRQNTYEMQAYKEKAKYDQIIKQQDPAYQLDLALKRKQLSKTETPDLKIVKINGKDYVQNADGSLSEPKVPTGTNAAQSAASAQQVANIDNLISSKGLAGAVGPNPLARSAIDFNEFTGVRGDFIAGVKQVTSGLTLDELVAKKQQGAAFGALSEGELSLLAGAATKINSWEIKDKNGNVIGYKTTDASMKKELQTIKELTQKGNSGSGVDTYLDSVDSVLQPQSPYGAYLTP